MQVVVSSFNVLVTKVCCSYEIIADISSLPTTSAPGNANTANTAVPFNGEGEVYVAARLSHYTLIIEGCGIANDVQRIVGGSEVPAHFYPWMVGLSFNSQWFCGGTLLNKGKCSKWKVILFISILTFHY